MCSAASSASNQLRIDSGSEEVGVSNTTAISTTHSSKVMPLVATTKSAKDRLFLARRINRLVTGLSVILSLISVWTPLLLWPAVAALAVACLGLVWLVCADVIGARNSMSTNAAAQAAQQGAANG